ncbi:alkaline phosphatase, partial [Paenibacillus riograndensis]
MHQLLNAITDAALNLVSSLGIWGIWIGMVLESACIPIPSEVIMLSGGLLIARGTLSFPEVVAAGVLGNLMGSIAAFDVGMHGGRKLLETGSYPHLT